MIDQACTGVDDPAKLFAISCESPVDLPGHTRRWAVFWSVVVWNFWTQIAAVSGHAPT